ncbi:unnamed protein product [Absidia cylindrospora]
MSEQGLTAKAAALEVGINIRTAQNYWKQYMEDSEQRLPGIEKKNATGSGAPKLDDEHSDFLVKYFDEHPAATLKVAKDALSEQVEGLTITQSGEKMCLTLKKLERLPAARDSPRVIEARLTKVSEWFAMPNFDYARDCVFIDEAGSNMHISRSFGRSKKGPLPKPLFQRNGVFQSPSWVLFRWKASST